MFMSLYDILQIAMLRVMQLATYMCTSIEIQRRYNIQVHFHFQSAGHFSPRLQFVGKSLPCTQSAGSSVDTFLGNVLFKGRPHIKADQFPFPLTQSADIFYFPCAQAADTIPLTFGAIQYAGAIYFPQIECSAVFCVMYTTFSYIRVRTVSGHLCCQGCVLINKSECTFSVYILITYIICVYIFCLQSAGAFLLPRVQLVYSLLRSMNTPFQRVLCILL